MRKSSKSDNRRVNRRKTVKIGGGRNVYVVIENSPDNYCHLHPVLYNTYEQAYQAAIAKYKEQLDEERAEAIADGLDMASQIDVVEDPAGVTKLYIEREIYITIRRFKIPNKRARRSASVG
jgi:hypothetical protein